MTVTDIHRILSGYTYRQCREINLQDGIKEVLMMHKISFIREYVLDAENRIDFWLPESGTGIEVKINGAHLDVMMQLFRYAKFDEIKSLILVSRDRRHAGMIDNLCGKPVRHIITRRNGF